MVEDAIQAWRRERLRALAAKFDGNAKLGRALGYRDGAYVGQMITGIRPITEKTVLAAEQLQGARGWFNQQASAGALSATTIRLQSAAAGKSPEDYELRQFDTGGAMGAGLVLHDQPGVIQSWRVTPEWVQKNLPYYTSLSNLAIVTGFGDSMVGLFNPGDPLIVDRGITRADVDGVYFFRVGDEGFIKRLQRIPGEGLIVISENPKYRDWTIKPDMDFQVMAKVLKSWNGQAL
jgi:hypothetical protein